MWWRDFAEAQIHIIITASRLLVLVLCPALKLGGFVILFSLSGIHCMEKSKCLSDVHRFGDS